MSMEINRSNYEAYLLDHLEGRLSAGDQQRLREFLALNPDCDPGLEAEELLTLSPDTIRFSGKDALKKRFPEPGQPLTGFHFDLISIARLEGDLSAEQIIEHEQMVKGNAAMCKEWEKLQLTRLPESSIEYPGKAQLKKPVGRVRRIAWITALSSAAAITFVILLLTQRSGPVTQLSQETGSSASVIEQETEDSPELSTPSTEKFQTVNPSVMQDQGSGSVLQEREPQQEVTVAQNQPGRMDTGYATVEDTALPGEDASSPDEDIDPESSQRIRIALANMPTPAREPVPDHIRPLVLPPSRVHTRNPGMADLAEMDLQEVVEGYAEEKNISLFSIATAGIRGINRITGSELELFAARDEEGGISGFQFKSKILNISTPVSKPE
jgi:hypothetical protein